MSYIPSPIHPNESPGFHAVLSQAAGSDAFRTELAGDPKAVLSRFGIDTSLLEIPAEVKLPPKDTLKCEMDSTDDLGREVLNWFGLIISE